MGAHSACILLQPCTDRSTDIIGVSLINILAPVFALYHYNARSSIGINRLLSGLATCSDLIVLLRCFFLSPSASNELHHEFMEPLFATTRSPGLIQHPWVHQGVYSTSVTLYTNINCTPAQIPVMLACLSSAFHLPGGCVADRYGTLPCQQLRPVPRYVHWSWHAAYVLPRVVWRLITQGMGTGNVAGCDNSFAVDNIRVVRTTDSTGGCALPRHLKGKLSPGLLAMP